jgi:hypothetical protein
MRSENPSDFVPHSEGKDSALADVALNGCIFSGGKYRIVEGWLLLEK